MILNNISNSLLNTSKQLLQILLLILFLPAYSLAQDSEVAEEDVQRYNIEIIIFEDAHSRYLNSETWPLDNAINNPITQPDAIEPAVTALSEDNSQRFTSIKPAILKKQYNGVKVSSEYKVLFYGAWRQDGLSESDAFEINIDELENNHKSSSQNTISGTFKLVLARYLHIYNNLSYQRNVTRAASYEESSTESNAISAESSVYVETYPLTSHRRMRSKELHYIDHPLVGILIQINPVEKPDQ